MKKSVTNVLNWFSRQFLHHQNMAGYLEPVIQLLKPSWRSGYYRAEVLAVTPLGENTLALELKAQSRWPIHLAGQHIELTCEINGSLKTRVFAIASSPNQAMHEGIKTQQQGAFTPYLTQLKKGDWVNISKPKGQFLLPENTAVTMFAAGSGITPFIAMLHQIKSEHTAPIHLVYYAKPGQHLLASELKSLSNRLTQFTFELLTRVEHGEVSERLQNYTDSQFLVCGPSAFFDAIATFAKWQNIKCESEHFSLMPLLHVTEEEQVFQVKHNGIAFNASNQQPLLAQYQEQNINVPYGCGMGVCHQCQCTKKKGVVRDMRTGKLSDYGEELIQLCVSQVVSDVELEA